MEVGMWLWVRACERPCLHACRPAGCVQLNLAQCAPVKLAWVCWKVGSISNRPQNSSPTHTDRHISIAPTDVTRASIITLAQMFRGIRAVGGGRWWWPIPKRLTQLCVVGVRWRAHNRMCLPVAVYVSRVITISFVHAGPPRRAPALAGTVLCLHSDVNILNRRFQ